MFAEPERTLGEAELVSEGASWAEGERTAVSEPLLAPRGMTEVPKSEHKFNKEKEQRTSMARIFHVIIQQDEDGVYVGKVPELAGCLSQGDTLDELMKNIKEAIELCLEVQQDEKQKISTEQIRFVGVQELEV